MTAQEIENDAVDAKSFDELTRQASVEMQPDADLEAMEFGLTLVRAGNRLQQDLENHVHRPAGMTWASFRVLFVIRSAGTTSPRQVARLSSISSASASSVLNTLERYDMILRTRNENDGRGITLSLTPKGEQAVTELFIRNNERAAEWATLFTPEEKKQLASLLHRVLNAEAPQLEQRPMTPIVPKAPRARRARPAPDDAQ